MPNYIREYSQSSISNHVITCKHCISQKYKTQLSKIKSHLPAWNQVLQKASPFQFADFPPHLEARLSLLLILEPCPLTLHIHCPTHQLSSEVHHVCFAEPEIETTLI